MRACTPEPNCPLLPDMQVRTVPIAFSRNPRCRSPLTPTSLRLEASCATGYRLLESKWIWVHYARRTASQSVRFTRQPLSSFDSVCGHVVTAAQYWCTWLFKIRSDERGMGGRHSVQGLHTHNSQHNMGWLLAKDWPRRGRPGFFLV
jgi:hypothetical protein